MKVLCLYSPGGTTFVRKGWGRAFKYSGHEFLLWDPTNRPAHDIFAEFEPDLAILTTYDTNRAIEKCIRARPNMQVVMYASAWGELADSLDPEKYPIVRVSEEEKTRLSKLKEETGRPDYVFIHVTDKYLTPTMGGWRSIGIEPYGLLNACDTFLYLGGKFRPELACDAGFVGSRWPYKGRNIDRFILPLCHSDSGINMKIFGYWGWDGIPRYLGQCSDQDNRDLFLSATVCPSVSEPHSTDLGFDVVERPFKSMGAGGFCVSDYVDEAREIFSEEELLMAKTPKEMEDMIRHYVAHPEERLPFIEKGRAKVLREHTYFDRVIRMLSLLGMENEAGEILAKKEACLETHLLP